MRGREGGGVICPSVGDEKKSINGISSGLITNWKRMNGWKKREQIENRKKKRRGNHSC